MGGNQYLDKSHRANPSQFFVAGELCRRELVALVTTGNCPTTDILCSNKDGTKFVHIQVKTFKPGDGTCSVGQKAEVIRGVQFFWVLAGIPPEASSRPHEYYIIPSAVMAEQITACHKLWMETPGKKGQAHNDSKLRMVLLPPRVNGNGWDIAEYADQWKLITAALK